MEIHEIWKPFNEYNLHTYHKCIFLIMWHNKMGNKQAFQLYEVMS